MSHGDEDENWLVLYFLMLPVTITNVFLAVASVSSKEMTNDIQEPQSDLVEIKHRPSRSDNNPEVDNYPVKPPQTPVSEDNVKPTGKNFITGAKHTEVFQIRVKRNFEGKKQLGVATIEEPPVCRRKTKPSTWDALDIMKHVRYSFLGDMFGARKCRFDYLKIILILEQLIGFIPKKTKTISSIFQC